jgi:drug/metabolite transporter (DMT)-like permease
MPAAALVLVLTAAVLHSCWNALTKRARDQLAFLGLAIAVGSLAFLPVTLATLPAGGVPAAAWPYVVATAALHAVYFYALGRSYRSGEFSLVYPVARGLGVALVPVLAAIVLDERPSAVGALGIALVVTGIVALQWVGRSPVAAGASLRPGLGWALVTGLTIAAYALVDKAGVGRLHPVPYIGLMFLGSLLLLLPAMLGNVDRFRSEWRANWLAIVLAAAMSLTAYLLVLFAFRLSQAGYVVAAREVSIVLSVVIGRLWFGERRLGPRLAGAALVLAGVACLALPRSSLRRTRSTPQSSLVAA